MPFSLGNTAGDQEIECPRCGEIFFYDLSACPACGLNLYEPDEASELLIGNQDHPTTSIFSKLRDQWKRLTKQNYTADEVFGSALDQAHLYNDLLQHLGGDHQAANRLIEMERKRHPKASRSDLIRMVISRVKRDRGLNTKAE